MQIKANIEIKSLFWTKKDFFGQRKSDEGGGLRQVMSVFEQNAIEEKNS